jgi:hypothetical protein
MPEPMQPLPTRRSFLLSSAVAGLGACAMHRPGIDSRAPPTLDIHAHLFGDGDSGSGCHLSKDIKRSLSFIILRRMLGLHRRGKGLDRGYAEALHQQIDGCALDGVAVLAQDCVYDAAGRPDLDRTHAFVPNDYLFGFVARHPHKTVACPSINPDRRDCIDELDRCVAHGARLLKIHPPIQGVDIAHPKHRRFFRRCAEHDILVMVHTGHEHAAPVIDIALADPRRMVPALTAGCRMVACHSGSGWNTDRPDYFGEFLELVGRFERLYGDTSVMATITRRHDLQRAIDAAPLASRLVHGSDFPFPSWPIAFADRIGRGRALLLQQVPNLLDRDFELKQLLGIGRATASRSYALVFPAGSRPVTRPQ